ncbi:MAG TPA: class I SAM-dependent RNA methyltransferase [Anaerolineales bacterium]|jgi:23S rRNA (uracil1939-C5)-methyltransferase
MDKPVEIIITTLSHGGEGIGRYNGRAIFVPFTLPGETVRAQIGEERKNFARARLVEVVKASAERIPPRCRHFGQCGGCHYQHLAYPNQLKLKTDILREQLVRIGKIAEPVVHPMVASPDEWFYRNHVQFHIDQSGVIGYVAASDPGELVPIQECFLPETSLNSLWPTLEFEPDSQIERVGLRAGMNDDILLVLESDEAAPPEMEIEAGISVVHLADHDSVVLAGEGYIFANILGRPFKVSAGSFFQVNTRMAEKMVIYLLESLAVTPTTTLLDVYCGVGLFSAFFAPKAGKVIGIESAPSSCDDYTTNLDEFDNVELYEGLAEEILPALDVGVNVAIVDPPRAGLDIKALEAILKIKPQKLAYVSCDPATLARDAARLAEGGYRLEQVTPFDLFPQTYHIESISLFVSQA